MPLLEVRDLSVAYDGAPALRGVSLEVQEGEIVSLVGANGAGKTTLLAAIAGLKPASAGSVLFEGRNVIGLPAHRLVQLGIGLVPEGRRLFPRQAVWRNLMLGAYRQRDRAWRQLQIDNVFQMFPVLRERRDQAAGTLSGGEQQMLAIGRALMSKPRLLLLDEPSLGIAPLLVDRIFNTLREINQGGLTLLLVEQRLKQALALAARAYVLQTGRIVLSGPSAEMAESEAVRRAYLGL
ncbi:MAG: ABC transporter ATP-binding protein [Candidatus Dormibacteraeota bacterium]|nr:ABC transporter ATP-binding protein [Candidatus Dormibacteraeota bacterium]